MVTLTIDGTVDDAVAALSAQGVVVGVDPELRTARVRGSFRDQPAQAVLDAIAVQLGPAINVVARPGGIWYVGKPSKDDAAVVVLAVPAGDASEWLTVYQAAASDVGRVTHVGDRIVIRDDLRALERIAQLHTELIEGRPQYVVQVCMVEMTWSAAVALGIDWDLSGALQLRVNWTAEDIAEAFASIAGNVHAKSLGTKYHIVTSMTLHCLEGQTARVQSGESIPIELTETFENGGSRVVGYEQVDVGTILEVSVRSAGENGVTVRIQPELSNVSGFVGDKPRVSVKKLDSTALVQFGGTVVLGGLDVDSERDDRTGIPGFRGVTRKTMEENAAKLFLFLRVAEVK